MTERFLVEANDEEAARARELGVDVSYSDSNGTVTAYLLDDVIYVISMEVNSEQG